MILHLQGALEMSLVVGILMEKAVPVLGSGVPTILSSPTVLEGQLSPLSCSGLPPMPPGFPTASPFQVLTLHKSEWGAEVVQLEMYYTQHGPGPAGVHPGRRRRCPWWGRGNWSLQGRNRREEDGEQRPGLQPHLPCLSPSHLSLSPPLPA